jgi:hypothetical protein
MAEHLECPECSKKTVVKRSEELYQCLSCDFKRDFSPPPQPKPEKGIFWASITATIFILLFLQSNISSNTKSLETPSSPVPTTTQSKIN